MLQFGTAGIRGIVGTGKDKLNDITVDRFARAYAEYLKENQKKHVLLGRDTRVSGEHFQRVIKSTLSEKGIVVFELPDPVSTPRFSFILNKIDADGGIMITASHNPEEYNGLKVYGHRGIQIPKSEAIKIEELYRENRTAHVKKSKIFSIESSKEDFYKEIENSCRFVDNADLAKIKVVYSPLSGSGKDEMIALMQRQPWITENIIFNAVNSEILDPTNKEVIKLSRAYLDNSVDIVLLNDPDADRIAIIINTPNGWKHFSGNELGELLSVYLYQFRDKSKEAVVISSNVSSRRVPRLLEDTVNKRVQVGFRNLIEERERLENVILSFEESGGFGISREINDKDGIGVALTIFEMVAWAKKRYGSIYEYYKKSILDTIGESKDKTEVIEEKIDEVRNRYTNKYLEENKEILQFIDYQDGYVWTRDKACFNNAPSVDMIEIVYRDYSVFYRPSGTEPITKKYTLYK